MTMDKVLLSEKITVGDGGRRFLLAHLLDPEAGGTLTAVEADGNRVICDDKGLEAQALVTLALARSSADKVTTESLRNSLAWLPGLKDTEFPGFTELSDRYWRPHPPGHARTLRHQLLAVLALLESGGRLGDDKLLAEGLDLLETCLRIPHDAGFPRMLARNWNTPLDDSRDLKTAALAVLVLSKASTVRAAESGYAGDLRDATENLTRFVDESNGGAHEVLSLDGTPVPAEGKKCSSMSLAAYAFCVAENMLGWPSLVQSAAEILSFVDENLKDPAYGGFWDRCATDGTVAVDMAGAYHGGYSPFPVKLVVDSALLFAAAAATYRATEEERYRALADSALEEIIGLRDRRAGGSFLGHGNWWSTAVDPTVPNIRQFWVAAHTPGAFQSGNLAYLPLQQKQALTQALTILALDEGYSSGNFIPDQPWEQPVPADLEALEPDSLHPDLDRTRTGDLENPKFDLRRYVNWLERAKVPGLAFGLTPYPSPLGFRADHTPQVFSAHHAIADLMILGHEIKDKDSVIANLRACQNPDGGFGEQPGHPSDVFTTYCGVLALFMLRARPARPEDCVTYLQSCQNPDGGFGDAPGYRSDLWHTNLAVVALHSLGAKPANSEVCVQFALACGDREGGYGVRSRAPAETFSAYRAICTLLFLGKRLPRLEQTVAWLKSCQTPEGAFVYRPGRAKSLVGTYHAVAALYLAGERPDDVEKCKEWIAAHQNPDGGFGPVNNPSATTDEGFTCLQSTFILEGALSRYWIALIS